MQINDLINFIGIQPNNNKYNQILDNKFLTQEIDIIYKMNLGPQYYKHLILNIEMDKSNPNNSYILWIYDKVDKIDLNKETKHSAGHSNMPDVDMDFEKFRRNDIIQYIKHRFGEDKTAHMVTFHRMQGRTAIKDVLRANAACSFDEMNKITANIPDEAKIADKLQEMREASPDGEASIIEWALDNEKKTLSKWCYLDDNGRCQGPMAKLFEQAMRLEGTKRSQSKHASGIIISQEPLSNLCPILYDKKEGEHIAGFEMNDLESIGLVKFDILGVSLLDKIHCVLDLMEEYKDEL